MTPTEQDKELRDGIISILRYSELDIVDDADAIMQLITADSKRVALEARLDELEKFVNTTNRSLSVKKLRDRLSELKAQQEANQQASKAKQEEA